MDTSLIFNFKRIDQNLDSAGLLNSEQLQQLGAAGYEVVINLLPVETEYAVKDEAEIIQGQGLTYHYIPVDFSQPIADDFLAFEQTLKAEGEKRILMHCAANYRVSAFYALFAFRNNGWTEEQLEEFIQSIWELDDYPVWRDFVRQILADSASHI